MNNMGTENVAASTIPTMLSTDVKVGVENSTKELEEARQTIEALKEEVEL